MGKQIKRFNRYKQLRFQKRVSGMFVEKSGTICFEVTKGVYDSIKPLMSMRLAMPNIELVDFDGKSYPIDAVKVNNTALTNETQIPATTTFSMNFKGVE